MTQKFFANKNLGQHFLKDKSVIETIVDSASDKGLAILEVGPGPGVLTERLALKNNKIQVVEKDERFKEVLADYVGKENVLLQDALTFSFQDLKEKTWLVSNLPYNISAPLTLLFFKALPIEEMTLMYQKEVGEKFLHPPVGNKLSSLSALSGLYFETKLIAKVKPGAFHPPPKVDSVVVHFKRKKEPLIPLDEFSSMERFLRSLFQFKRKQIKSNLKGIISPDLLAQLKIDEKIRAEDLLLDQVVQIYQKRA